LRGVLIVASAALLSHALAACHTPGTARLAVDGSVADAPARDVPSPPDDGSDAVDVPSVDVARCDADLARTESHCGACGRACGPREACVEGACERVTSLAAGRDHTCAAVSPSGRVLCWGSNAAGQIGLGANALATVPTPALLPGIDGVVELGAGRSATCARRGDGSVWCWGENVNARGERGRLGVGATTANVTAPQRVTGLGNARRLAIGEETQCALLTSGEAWCWGGTSLHAFGGAAPDGSFPTFSATPLRLLTAWPVAELSVGANHLCARSAEGAVRCWGANGGGQLGIGTLADRRAHPLSADAIASGATEVVAGARISCAAFGGRRRVACWGSLDMIGLSGAPSLVPQEVPGTEGWRALSLTARVLCAISGAGVGCFGENRFGQLGRATSMTGPEPAGDVVDLRVGDGPVAAGTTHACAVDLFGAVRCRGEDTALGDGAGFARAAPTYARDLP
jgi:alpha-tubulin suppressor-like RCC1 family protein